MNYTKPNDENHQDDPLDWLNGALLFARALSILLPEGQGVVINVVGDAKNPINEESDKVVVFNLNGQIHIDDVQDSELKEGDYIKLQTDEQEE